MTDTECNISKRCKCNLCCSRCELEQCLNSLSTSHGNSTFVTNATKHATDILLSIKNNKQQKNYFENNKECIDELLPFLSHSLLQLLDDTKFTKSICQIFLLFEPSRYELVDSCVANIWSQIYSCLLVSSVGNSVTNRVAGLLSAWTTLFDLVKSARRNHVFLNNLPTFINYLCLSLNLTSVPHDCGTLSWQRMLYVLNKTLNQCCQEFFQSRNVWTADSFKQLKAYITGSSDDGNMPLSSPTNSNMLPAAPACDIQSADEARDCNIAVSVVGSVLRVLKLKMVSRDCLMVAGCCLGFMLTLCETPSLGTEVFCSVFSKTIDRDGDHHVLFGQLCVLQGLLSYADKALLLCSEFSAVPYSISSTGDSKSSSFCSLQTDYLPSCFILSLFPLLCQFCSSSSIKYQSFRVLESWLCHLIDLQKTSSFVFSGLIIPAVHDDDLQRTHKAVCDMADCCPSETALSDSCGDVAGSISRGPLTVVLSTSLSLITGFSESSNVEGATEVGAALLNVLLDLDDLIYQQKLSASSLSIELFNKSCALNWPCKSKYLFLTVTLRRLQHQQVLSYCVDIMSDLLKCLNTNFLTPCATQVYEIILTVLSKDNIDEWKSLCWPSLHLGLTSSNSLQRRNACEQWLPLTVRLIKTSANFMLQELRVTSHSDACLYSIVSLVGIVRSRDLTFQLPTESLKLAFKHPDNSLRLSAFKLLSSSDRKTAVFSCAELSLVRSFLPFNLNIDDAAFRKQLVMIVGNTVCRLRDSALSSLRQSVRQSAHYLARGDAANFVDLTSADVVCSAVDFIDWLWSLCINDINCSANFQRIQMCLSVIRLILESLIERGDNANRRKGGVPCDVKLLIEFARRSQKFDFFTSQSSTNILTCVFHSADEIREMAVNILSVYFPWPLVIFDGPQTDVSKDDKVNSDLVNSTSSTTCQLLTTALSSCQSIRPRECETGALLCSLIFNRSVIQCQTSFTIGRQQNSSRLCVTDLYDVGQQSSHVVHFVSQLIGQIDLRLKMATDNIVVAAKEYPVHGLMLALRRCLEQKLVIGAMSHDEWRQLSLHVKSQVENVVRLALGVFRGKLQNDDGSAPSFEQMSRSISELIVDADLDLEYDDVSLSAEHQLVSTWCWTSIRECGLLLGQLVDLVVGFKGHDLVLDVDDVTQIGQLFVRTLASCRHRGAIEGCSIGFSMFCTAVFKCSDAGLNSVPAFLLHSMLNQIESSCDASVTRRSAGLPLALDTILAAEASVKQMVLVDSAVSQLLCILSKPVSVTSESRDIAQVHALHILRSLVQDSHLVLPISRYYATLTVTALNGFCSEFWAVRNACLQLLGALVPKLVGEKKTRDDELCTTSASIFYIQYPSLGDFIISVLDQATLLATASLTQSPTDAGVGIAGKQFVSVPSPLLFPVLSLLCRLSPDLEVEQKGQRFISSVCNHLRSLACSPVYAVRRLAGHALCRLVPSHLVAHHILDIVSSLPMMRSPDARFNELHGKLLQVEFLVKSLLATTAHRSVACTILSQLATRRWLLSTSRNKCSVVRAAFLRIVTLLVSTVDGDELVGTDRVNSENIGGQVEDAVGVNTEVTGHFSTNGHQTVSVETDSGAVTATCVQYSKCFDEPLATEMSLLLSNKMVADIIGHCEWTKCLVYHCLSLTGLTLCVPSSTLATVATPTRPKWLTECLQSNNYDVISASVTWLMSCDVGQLFDEEVNVVMEQLWQLMLNTNLPNSLLLEVLSVLCRLYNSHVIDVISSRLSHEAIYSHLLTLIHMQPSSSLAGVALQLTASVVKYTTSARLTHAVVRDWLLLIETYSHETQPDHMRVSSVHAIQVAAPTVMETLERLQNTDTQCSCTALQLLKVLLHLLNDALTEVRDIAARVVSTLVDDNSVPTECNIHYNHAIQLLLTCVTATWCHSLDSKITVYNWLRHQQQQQQQQQQQLFDDVTGFSADRCTNELFITEDDNPFFEQTVLYNNIQKALQETVFPISGSEWLSSEVASRTLELQQMTQQLNKLHGGNILSAAINKHLYDFLCSLVCRSNVLLKWLNDVNDVKPCIQQQLTLELGHLLQVPCVHLLSLQKTGVAKSVVK